jgi:hypothetical protein
MGLPVFIFRDFGGSRHEESCRHMGSASDLPVVQKALDTLAEFGVPAEAHVYSAHRTPEALRLSAARRAKAGSASSWLPRAWLHTWPVRWLPTPHSPLSAFP